MRTFIIAVLFAMLSTCSGRPWDPTKQKFRKFLIEQRQNGGSSGGQNGGSSGGQNGGSSGGQNGGSSGGQNGGSSGGQNGGSSGPGQGGAGPMNPDQWLTILQTKCNLDLAPLVTEKVTPDEVFGVLYELHIVAQDAAANFSVHSNLTQNLTNSLEQVTDQTLSELIASHTVLIRHFMELVASASDAGVCPFGHLAVLLQRLQFIGGEGFSEVDSCDRSFLAIKALETQYGSMDNAYADINVTWLHIFGSHVREDMQCVSEDIQKFEHKIEEIMQDALTDHVNGNGNSQLPMREVQLDLATINAYAGILEREIRRLKCAVFAVGMALDHLDIPALEAGGGGRDLERILQLLKMLRTA